MKSKKTTTTRRAATRPQFAVRAIRNANPNGFRVRKGGVLARMFSL